MIRTKRDEDDIQRKNEIRNLQAFWIKVGTLRKKDRKRLFKN